MNAIKRLLHRCYLFFLRLRLFYAAGVVHRVSRRFAILYHASLSRALWQLSLWEWQYKECAGRYLAKKEETPHEPNS